MNLTTRLGRKVARYEASAAASGTRRASPMSGTSTAFILVVRPRSFIVMTRALQIRATWSDSQARTPNQGILIH
ncbi:unnamed protein product [Mycena citricolor]|uniref:Uncharacterized protein n=1 Tax=Mycena citricolor TaxID=2018698 RepID=A0AAD2K5V1_9AGAR|nr:unnamed protein product [Mycena citricolor]